MMRAGREGGKSFLLIKARTESWKKKEPGLHQTVGSTTNSRYLNFRYVDTKLMHAIMV